MKAYLRTSLKISLFLIFTFVLFSQCQSGPPPCKYKPPVAIFSKELEPIQHHRFEVSGQDSREGIVFKNGIQMEILQSGCNDILQVFQFYIPGDLKEKNSEYWIEMAIQHFAYLSTVSNQHFSLHYWSDAISEKFHELKLGRPTELQAGYAVKIDKVLSPDHSLLIVELSGNIK